MDDDAPTTEELRRIQADRERAERERGEEAPTAAERKAALRRADKAAYLHERLAEQAASDPEDDG